MRLRHLVHLLCYDTVGAWLHDGGHGNERSHAHSQGQAQTASRSSDALALRADAAACLDEVLCFLAERTASALDPLTAGEGGAMEALIRSTLSKPALLVGLESLLQSGPGFLGAHLADLRDAFVSGDSAATTLDMHRLVQSTLSVLATTCLCPEGIMPVMESGLWSFMASLPLQPQVAGNTGMHSHVTTMSAAFRLVRVAVTAGSGHDEFERADMVSEADEFFLAHYKRLLQDKLFRRLHAAVGLASSSSSSGGGGGITSGGRSMWNSDDVVPSASTLAAELACLAEAVALAETVALGSMSVPQIPFRMVASDATADLVGLVSNAGAALYAGVWRIAAARGDDAAARVAKRTTVLPGAAALMRHPWSSRFRGKVGSSTSEQRSQGSVFAMDKEDLAASWSVEEMDSFHKLVVILFCGAGALRALGHTATSVLAAAATTEDGTPDTSAAGILRNSDLSSVAEAFGAIGNAAICVAAAEGDETNHFDSDLSSTLSQLATVFENASGDVLLFLEHALAFRAVVLPPLPEEAAQLREQLAVSESFSTDTEIYAAARRIDDLLATQ